MREHGGRNMYGITTKVHSGSEQQVGAWLNNEDSLLQIVSTNISTYSLESWQSFININ